MLLINKLNQESRQEPNQTLPFVSQSLPVVKPAPLSPKQTNFSFHGLYINKSVEVMQGSNWANFLSKAKCWNTRFMWRLEGSEIIINVLTLKGSASLAVQWLGVEKRALQRVAFKGGFNYYMETLSLCCHLSLSFAFSLYIYFPISPSATTCQI